MIASITPWHEWYLATMIIAWATQIVIDGTTNSKRPYLEPQVFYVAVAIVWPFVLLATAFVICRRWVASRTPALKKAWGIVARWAVARWRAIQQLRRSVGGPA